MIPNDTNRHKASAWAQFITCGLNLDWTYLWIVVDNTISKRSYTYTQESWLSRKLTHRCDLRRDVKHRRTGPRVIWGWCEVRPSVDQFMVVSAPGSIPIERLCTEANNEMHSYLHGPTLHDSSQWRDQYFKMNPRCRRASKGHPPRV